MVPLARLSPIAAMLIAALLVTGCASTHDGPAPASLDGTSWRLESWSPVGAASGLDPRDFEITAKIDGAGIGGKSAINSYFGPLTHGADGTFQTGLLGSTMMAGTERAMRAEQAFMHLIQAARRFEMLAGNLVLFDGDGTQLLSFRSDQ